MKKNLSGHHKEENVSSLDEGLLHKEKTPSAQSDGFIVATIEDSSIEGLTSVKVEGEIPCTIKHKKRRLKIGKAKRQVYTRAKKLQKRANWKRRLFNFAVVIVLGVATGSVLGSWYFNSVNSSQFDPSKYNELNFRDDEVALRKNLMGKSEPTWEDFSILAESKTPLDFTASQNFLLAEYKATQAQNYRIITNGKVSTIASQTVYGRKLYNGKKCTYESISKGMMTIAKCSYRDMNSNIVKVMDGTNVTSTSAKYNLAKAQNYTLNDYIDYAGGLPEKVNPYIVSSKTVLNDNEVQIVFNEETGNYEFTMELDATGSTLNYTKQVRQTSGLSGYPTFNYVRMKVVMSPDWNLVQTDILEKYTVVYGVKASCVGTALIDYEFNVEGDLDFPV